MQFIQMFEYKRWADLRMLDAVKDVDPQRQQQPLAFMHRQLNHMVIVEELFRARLEGTTQPHTATYADIPPDLSELAQRMETSHTWFLDFITRLQAEQAHDAIQFEFADGRSGRMHVEEILFHIVNHGSYHRGTIAHALDLAGVSHPPDGYGIYIHAVDPARRESEPAD